MRKEKLIEIIEDFKDYNLERQNLEEVKEMKTTYDNVYKYANDVLDYILNKVNQLD